MHSSEVFKFLLLRIVASLLRVVLFGESIIGPTIPGLIQLFGFLGFSMTGMEGVTSNGSTYPSWTGPRADWRAILSSLINARVMDSVGFKPACSCWRHNRQDTTTLATLDTTTMFQLTTLSLVFLLVSLITFALFFRQTWDIPWYATFTKADVIPSKSDGNFSSQYFLYV